MDVIEEAVLAIAESIGVQIMEEFGIWGLPITCRFTKTRLQVRSENGQWNNDVKVLIRIVDNRLKVKKLHWYPRQGERYWYVTSSGSVYMTFNNLALEDLSRFRTGNCYRSKAKAMACRSKLHHAGLNPIL